MTSPRPQTAVVHLDHSSANGGAELALRRLLVSCHGWRATVLVPPTADLGLGVFAGLDGSPGVAVRQSGLAQPPGASQRRMSAWAALRFGARIAAQVVAICADRDARRADVIHANTSRSAVYGALVAQVLRKRLVVHVRDFVTPEALGRLGWWSFTRLALRRANGVIANSNATLLSARPWTRPGTPAVVIASPIGVTAAGRSRVAGGAVDVIGMVARISPWKGHDVVLRAFAAELAGTSIRLVFAGGVSFGEDDHLVELRALAADLGVEAQVEFLGHVVDVAGLVDGFDICVQASTREEPLGQNVLQYLAAGRPTIVVDAGGPAEWVTDGVNGLLVAMGDVAALAAALRRLVDSPSLRTHLALGAGRTPIQDDRTIAALHGQFFDRVGSLPKARRSRPGVGTPSVCFVAAPLTARSGVYRSTLELVEAGRQQGYDWRAYLGVSASAAGAPLHESPPWIVEVPAEPAGLRGVTRLRRQLAASDLVRSADLRVSLVPQTDMAHALSAAPWIAYLRGLPWPAAGEAAPSRRNAWRFLERLALGRSRAVWATTTILQAQAGIDATLVPPGLRLVPRTWDGHGERRRVVWAARFDVDKDPDLFCRVVGSTPFEGVMYGDGPLRAATQRAAPANVAIAGWVDPTQVWDGAMAYLGTSVREAFGRSAVEAAMSGVPVLLTTAFGAAELLYTDRSFRRRFILGSSSPEAWQEALDALAADEQLRCDVSDHLRANAVELGVSNAARVVAQNAETVWRSSR